MGGGPQSRQPEPPRIAPEQARDYLLVRYASLLPGALSNDVLEGYHSESARPWIVQSLLSGVVPKIVLDSLSVAANPFDPSKLSRPVAQAKSWNACASHLTRLWMHAHEQAVHRRREWWGEWKAGRLDPLAPFLVRSHATKLSMRGVLVVENELMQQAIHVWVEKAGMLGSRPNLFWIIG